MLEYYYLNLKLFIIIIYLNLSKLSKSLNIRHRLGRVKGLDSIGLRDLLFSSVSLSFIRSFVFVSLITRNRVRDLDDHDYGKNIFVYLFRAINS